MRRLILTVDDSVSLRQMVSLTLRQAGYEVLEAEDGQAGLELAKGHEVALVITDQTMPRLDGVSLIAALRALPAYALRPIIVLTTETDPEIKVRARNAGATGWMNKPFNPERLLEIVAKLLPDPPPASAHHGASAGGGQAGAGAPSNDQQAPSRKGGGPRSRRA
ncbi:MAG: response regulator [Betaproteobacteria bacterium]|nr:response regulator [Betaproteobacteria bacterium]